MDIADPCRHCRPTWTDDSVSGERGHHRPAPVGLPITVSATNHHRVVVAVGDHLWKISSRHLKTATVETSDVATYWRAVIDLNRDDLRSGNPDLIYPGEVISLPSVSSANG